MNRTLFALVFIVVMGTMTLVKPVAAVLGINPAEITVLMVTGDKPWIKCIRS